MANICRKQEHSVTSYNRSSFFEDAPVMVIFSKKKIASPLFAASIRIISQCTSEHSAIAVVSHVSNGLSNSGIIINTYLKEVEKHLC